MSPKYKAFISQKSLRTVQLMSLHSACLWKIIYASIAFLCALSLFPSLDCRSFFYHFTISFLPYEAIRLVVQTICLLFLFLSSVVLMPSEIVIFVCHSTKSFSFVWFYMSSIWSLFVSCCQSYSGFLSAHFTLFLIDLLTM